jgi:hypothetical protein
MNAVKLNLSFEASAAELIRSRAQDLGKPISRYLADLAEAEARGATDRLAAEGYRELARDTADFAAEALAMAGETWPEWQESHES